MRFIFGFKKNIVVLYIHYFCFTTSELNVNQEKRNQFVSVKCHTSIAATSIVIGARPGTLTQYFSII